MNNLLILGKYSSFTIIEKLIELVGKRNRQCTRIIVKEGDEIPESPLVVTHGKNMQGDVCDLLWEVADMDQELPLVVASTRGVLNNPTQITTPAVSSLVIVCSESNYAGFKFDSSKNVYESADLTASMPYLIHFERTGDFTRAAEELIIQHKSEKNGKFELRTLVNQFILQGEKIEVKITNLKENAV